LPSPRRLEAKKAPTTGASQVTPTAWVQAAGAATFSSPNRKAVTAMLKPIAVVIHRLPRARAMPSPAARPKKPTSRQTPVRR
jgi:hypothetical protein